MAAMNWGLDELKNEKRSKHFIWYPVVAIIFLVLAYGTGHSLETKQKTVDNVALILHGGLDVDANDLHSLIVSKGLTVYWLGPEVGTKYLLNTSLASGISLRYIYSSASTGSNGTNKTYFEVGTFASPNAFALTQRAGLQPNGVGLINPDGDAVYYDSRDPKNVYIGLKNVDIQVEIFDPRPDQALAAAMLEGNIQKIS